MRIFEIELPPTYLQSDAELKIGTIVDQPHACDLGTGPEHALELCRPEAALPRDASLRLHAECQQDAPYVYRVIPIGQVDRFHTSWLRKLADASIYREGERSQYASGFWSGEPLPEDRDAPWEYRAMKAKVLKRAGGSALSTEPLSLDKRLGP